MLRGGKVRSYRLGNMGNLVGTSKHGTVCVKELKYHDWKEIFLRK